MRVIAWLIFLLLFVLGAVFALPNAHPVTLNYYIGSAEMSLAVLLLSALWAGVLLSLLFSGAKFLDLLYQNRRLRREKQSLEKENTALRLQVSKEEN